MSISAVSSTATSTATATTSSTSTTSSSSSLGSTDFLTLIVTELENQNPLNPTDTSEFMNQMMSYATFSQISGLSETLDTMNETLTTIASQVTSLYAASGSSSAA